MDKIIKIVKSNVKGLNFDTFTYICEFVKTLSCRLLTTKMMF